MTTPLIPRDVLFGNPERAGAQISPDGKHLTYLAPDKNNVLQVWIRTLGQQDDRMLTADKKRGIRSYQWTYNPDLLTYIQDSDGDENWHVYSVNIRSGGVRDLTPFQGIQAQLVAREPKFPDVLLIAMNVNDRKKHDVYRVNLQNVAVEPDTENPGNVMSWDADARLRIRAAVAGASDGGMDLLLRGTPKEPCQTARHWGPEDQGGPVSFSKDGRTLYILGSHDANAMRLIALNLKSGKETVIAENPVYDVASLLIHPVTRVIQAVSFRREREEWRVLDKGITADFEALAQVRRGEFRVVSRDLADTTWLVAYTTDDGPAYYYAYDRASKASTLLFSNRPKLEGLPLAQMKPVAYTSRDGLTIHGYLTTPVGVPAQDLSAILLVHGGPWGRDAWGFHPWVQWLANRGYAVLQVNYRGSAGYGKKFLNAGNREWAAKMHDDLIDGVNWLISQGVADPKKTAIMGGSYGGYATLVGLTFTPDVFAAGVDLVGPSSLVTLLKNFPPYWAPMMKLLKYRVGDPDTEADFLNSRSPLFFADRIKAPLLIGQGANDPRVTQLESEQIVAAMRKAGRPVEYIVYSDEGHGFARPENNLHFFAKAEEFLAKYLGGRSEPVGEVKGHSATIR